MKYELREGMVVIDINNTIGYISCIKSNPYTHGNSQIAYIQYAKDDIIPLSSAYWTYDYLSKNYKRIGQYDFTNMPTPTSDTLKEIKPFNVRVWNGKQFILVSSIQDVKDNNLENFEPLITLKVNEIIKALNILIKKDNENDKTS